jgi:4-diphosphocytidyl-2-C-methyl-D-erythritol kinase
VISEPPQGKAPSRVRVRCPAKINLGFWILGRREDGYHEVDTILQAITLEDELLLESSPEPGLVLVTSGIPIRGEAPNLIERSWELLRASAEKRSSRGIRVRLTKRIPVGAGLGGGSSDAAGFLEGANRLLALGLHTGELASLGARIGSDVPFFFRGGIARAGGRGEQLRQLCPTRPFWIVLATPPFDVSTSWAYGRARICLTPDPGDGNVLERALAKDGLDAALSVMRNEFEDVVFPEFPILVALKRALEGAGAAKALLAGSGSTLGGLARSREDALLLAKGIAGWGVEIRVARTLDRGVAVAPLA